jgi:regulator of sigma E protease
MLLSFFFNYIFLFLLLIIILVFVHELGHYLFARFFGVAVESFSIGFGKELIGWTDKKGTRWKLSLIPLGGYVKMKGEMISKDSDSSNKELDSFESKNLFAKFCIVFAGPLFNLLFPILIFFSIFFFAGNTTYSNKIGEVVENSPASKYLFVNDEIIQINGVKVESFNDIRPILEKLPNKEVEVVIKRNDKIIKQNITLSSINENGKDIGILGIKPSLSNKKTNYSLLTSIQNTFSLYYEITVAIKTGLVKLFTGNISLNDVGGPVKISQYSAQSSKDGVGSWFFMMALFSINLAIINLFPIPALDGGHLLIYILQGITRRKFSYGFQIFLNKIGVYLLIFLMLFIMLKDVIELFYKNL